MNQIFMAKGINVSTKLMMTSCLLSLSTIPVNAFQLSLNAFTTPGFSLNPTSVLNLIQTNNTLQTQVNTDVSGENSLGILIDTVNSGNNLTTRLTTQINNIEPSGTAVSTSITDVKGILGGVG